ncbi:MAG TPA: tail fiber domain-containing protein [Pyrinomonadaceae bacterium]|nr:tail fiber domain-containing protein [Pyrinomonadaceae bacterium]
MNFGKYFRLAAIALTAVAFAQITQAQSFEKMANMTAGAGNVRWDVAVPNGGGTLVISFPDGRTITRSFYSSSVQFDLTDKQLEGAPDGVYNYELRLAPVLTGNQRAALVNSRGRDDEPESDREARKRPTLTPLVQSGSFAVVNGMVIGPGAVEGQRAGANKIQQLQPKPQLSSPAVSGNTISRLRNHRFSLGAMPDQVIADDLIVQGSACVGLDCVNNESFGFDTIRLKENNTRIKFDDTSTGTGFPNHDWQLTANDSASGGANKFSIEDITAATVPVTITGSAPTNSLFVASGGNVGLGNSSPVLNLHITSSNTPALRQEQTNSGGFTAQTWDIGGNEANWFVRDVTGGSRLPLRIRPGAPTSSVDISATGNVGIGTASPDQRLSVAGVIQTRGAGAGGGLLTFDNAANFWRISQTVAGNTGKLQFSQDGVADVMTLTNTGAGFATNAPTATLSVNGTANKPGGGSWDVFSDERLKNINGRFSPGLSAVMRIQPLRYHYTSKNELGLPSDREYFGFGAGALQKVLPEAVSKNANGYLQVNNDPILLAMLNAIKEQQQEIASLKAQVRKLQSGRASRRSRH